MLIIKLDMDIWCHASIYKSDAYNLDAFVIRKKKYCVNLFLSFGIIFCRIFRHLRKYHSQYLCLFVSLNTLVDLVLILCWLRKNGNWLCCKKNKIIVILFLVGRSYCLAVSESLCMFCLDSNEKSRDIDANLI